MSDQEKLPPGGEPPADQPVTEEPVGGTPAEPATEEQLARAAAEAKHQAAAAAAGSPDRVDDVQQPAAPAEQPAPASEEEAKAAAKAAALEKAKAAAAAKKAAAAAGAGGEGGEKPAAKPKPAHPPEDPNKPAWEKDPVTPEWEEAGDDPLAAALREELGEAIESAKRFAGDLALEVRRESVAEVAASLKAKHRFTYLVDVCGADFPGREPRFDVIYHAYSFDANRRVRLKVRADEGTPVPTVCGVWRAANWSEREVYDMYGVRFEGHPDMTRILLWEGFNGHPLRKDFPVEGIDTGTAIYPEYYEESAGPISGTGTGWKTPKPPKPPGEPAEPGEEAS